MGLESSMYAGITGLTVHSERMGVIGNNLANVNTTGFKGSRMDFQDVMCQDFPTASGIAQVGRGVRVSSIFTDFGQGSFETTSESTDMAISGDGFFTVKEKQTENTFYTRAGNFRFDKDGYLVDPNGLVVQGWAVERSASTVSATASTTTTSSTTRIVGSPTDIRLENFQSPPQATSLVTMITNLDPTVASKSDSDFNPYFAMFENWDGTQTTPLASTAYSYSSTLNVYDEIGTAHNLTVYFDPVALSNAGSDTVWEFMVTCAPSEDGRTLSSAGTTSTVTMSTTSAAGVLMVGTMTFRTGQLVGMSGFTLKSGGGGNVKDLNNWKLADFTTAGYPAMVANFLRASNASTTQATNAVPIGINFGIRNTNLTSNGGGRITKGWRVSRGTLASSAGAIGPRISNTGWLPTFKGPTVSALSSQSYNTGGSSTLFQGQDGYSAGVLQSVSVSREGVLTGRYSNGQVLELYSLTLSTFTNKWALHREGSNLFSETRDSGPALTGQAGSAGKGTVDGNSLELSNVDMATEFVRMITTQRGFKANTKVITTADSMLGDVIAMKR